MTTNIGMRKPDFYAIQFIPSEPVITKVDMIPVWGAEDASKLQRDGFYILQVVEIKISYEVKQL